MKTTTTQPQHTQGEWKQTIINSDVIEITPKDDWKVIARLTTFDPSRDKSIQTFEQIEANAQRIVKAVNMHDELVKELKMANELLENRGVTLASITKLLKQAKQK